MLDRERPDIAIIALRWLGERRDMALAGASAGAHLFIEKPLAATLAVANQIVEAAKGRA